MLLTRSLPPQFLLPAWSTRQLAGAHAFLQQRARISDDTGFQWIKDKQRFGSEDQPRVIGPDKKVFGSEDKPRRIETERKDSALSLFEELFPEESEAKKRAAQRRKLSRLPAFGWPRPRDGSDDTNRESERSRQLKSQLHASSSEQPLTFKSLRESPKQQGVSLRAAEQERRGEMSVLVLNSATKTLEESDFFRLGPKGEHIKEWTSGIIKVIHGRDNTTLQPLGYYFLVFSNDAAAKAYLDMCFRVWKAAKHKGQWLASGVAGLPLPPGLLKPGEDVHKLMKGFTIVHPWNKLFLRMVSKPFRPAMQQLLDDGGPAAIVASKTKAEDMVLVSSDVGYIEKADLFRALRADGKHRNLHWKLAGNSIDDIVPLQGPRDDNVDNDMDVKWGARPEVKRRTLRPSARYVVSFTDRYEARRFVREWHKRPMPQKKYSRPGDEQPLVVNAEILW